MVAFRLNNVGSWIICMLIAVLIPSAHLLAADDIQLIPQSVSLGMTAEQLLAARPKLLSIPALANGEADRAEYAERMVIDNSNLVYRYSLKGNHVGAVVCSIVVRNEQKDKTIEKINILLDTLQKTAAFGDVRRAVKTSGTQAVEVTVQKWVKNDTNTVVLFLASTEEITLVSLDPGIFAFDDFFLSSDHLPQAAAHADSVRSTLQTTSIDGNSATDIADLLGVVTTSRRLLPEVKAASVSRLVDTKRLNPTSQDAQNANPTGSALVAAPKVERESPDQMWVKLTLAALVIGIVALVVWMVGLRKKNDPLK